MTDQSRLLSISPLDGRYSEKTGVLSPTISEFALIRNRVEVEVSYLKFFQIYVLQKTLDKKCIKTLDEIISHFDENEAVAVKKIEDKVRRLKLCKPW